LHRVCVTADTEELHIIILRYVLYGQQGITLPERLLCTYVSFD